MQGQGGHFILGSRTRRAQQVNYFLLFFELSFPHLEAGIQRDPLNNHKPPVWSSTIHTPPAGKKSAFLH